MIDLAVHVERVARHIFGEPNWKHSKRGRELRFGTHGSLSVMIAGAKRGTWFDHEQQIGGGVVDMLRGNGIKDGLAEWFERELGIDIDKPQPQRVVATYNYVDEAGALLFQVLRWGPEKKFSQQQPGAGKGGIERGPDGRPTMQGARYVPYHLDELVAAKETGNGHPWRVYVVEGEKDADRLRQWGLLATTNPGGASKGKSKWRSDYNQYFTGSEAIIIGDNDDVGRVHVAAVAVQLAPVAAIVRVLALGGLDDGEDISDWIDDGGTEGTLEDLVGGTDPLPHPDENQAPPPDDDADQAAALAALNASYQVVNEAGKCIVMKWRRDPTLDREVLDRMSFADFKRMYLNRFVGLGKKKRRNLADWWLTHSQRLQYLGGVTLDPTGTAPADHLNLWRGFAVEPAPGDWSLLRDHIFKIVCRGEKAHAEYVLNWLARLFQHPEDVGEIALVLRGKKGVGKSILGVWVARALAHHGLHITHAEQLVGRFNAHLRDLVVLFADEAFFAGDKQHEGVLKGLITEATVVVEGKYQAVVAVRNMLHLIMSSNNDWVIPASTDERRFAVFDVLDTRIGDRAYFANIDQQMRSGGLAAMLHELRGRDITDFEVRDVPQTAALRTQKTLSMSSVERWWLNVLDRGYLYRSRHGAPWFDQWHDFYTNELLNNSYSQWCDEHRPRDRKSREQLGMFFAEIYTRSRPRGEHPDHENDTIDRRDMDGIPNPNGSGFLRPPKTLDEIAIVQKDHPMGYQVGELVEARDRFAAMRDVDTPWGGDPDE